MSNYIPVGYTPVVDMTMPTGQALNEIGKKGARAVVVVEHGAPKYLASIDSVVTSVFAQASSEAEFPRIMARPFSETVPTDSEAIIKLDINPNRVVMKGKIPSENDLSSSSVSACVGSDGGDPVGWGSTDRMFSTIVNSPPVIYLCENNHENVFYSDGFCSSCPLPLVKVKQ